MGGTGARIDVGAVLALMSPQRVRAPKPSPSSEVSEVRIAVKAPAGWCRGALLGTAGQEPVDADPDRRKVNFELTRLGRRVHGTKIVDVEPLRLRAWLVSGRLPWFEEIVELRPLGEEETEIVWSVGLDPGDTLLRRAHVRLARRWLVRDARSRLESIRRAAVARAGLRRAATPAERVTVSA